MEKNFNEQNNEIQLLNKQNEIKNIINKVETKKFNNRIYGLDLLKIFSVINIIILHIMMFGGRFLKLKPNDKRYKATWNLEALGYWGVNGFALISGIVGYKKYKFSNLIYLWFLSSFYSIIITSFCYYYKIISLNTLYLSIFPLLLSKLWYFNAYFCLYLFIPFINLGINNLNRNTYKNLIILYFLFYSIYYIIGHSLLGKNNDFFYLQRGLSPLWLMTLYIVGAYYGKFIIPEKKSLSLKNTIHLIIIYFLSSFFTSQIFLLFKNDKYFCYISPSIVIQSISLVILFSKINIKRKCFIKIISFFSQFTYSAIFIHLRIMLPNIPLEQWFLKKVNTFSPDFFYIKIYCVAIIIYFLCSIIDYFRLLLFNCLKIRELSIFIEKIITLILNEIKF